MSTEAAASVRFVSVKFAPIARPQTFLLNDLLFAGTPPVAGDKVVVQSEAGTAIGTIVPTAAVLIERRQPPDHSPNRVVRKATPEDVTVRLKRQQREQEAHRVALLKIRERGLDMKLTRVEQLFDGSRLIFYFTAEGRVDFRELVRELASEFHTRIEMRRIGAATGQDARRVRVVRTPAVLHHVVVRRAGLDQDGEAKRSTNRRGCRGCGRLKCCLRYELSTRRCQGGGCGDEGDE
jgi:cell fate regulator YaaT (PSP1 superfamily)